MELAKIYWKAALELIHQQSAFQQEQIEFNNEMIPIEAVLAFNQNGYRVPQELVEYNDEDLDYSDNPAITEDDIQSGRVERIYTAEIPMKEEVVEWLKTSKINLNDLVTELVNNFYQTMKRIHENAAL